MSVIVTINNVKTKVVRFRSFASHFVNKRSALFHSPQELTLRWLPPSINICGELDNLFPWFVRSFASLISPKEEDTNNELSFLQIRFF